MTIIKSFSVDVSSVSPLSFSLMRANAQNVSCRNSLRWPVYIINSVNLTKLPCYTPPLIQLHSFFRNVPHLWLINWLIDYLTDWPLIDWLIDCLNLYMFVINLIHHGKSVCMVHVFMHPLVWVRNLTCSLHCLFQFLLLPTHA